MGLSRSAKIRVLIAAFIGIPTTLLYGSVIGVVLFLVHSTGQLRLKEFLFALWCLSGAGGLAGFWTWIFASRPMSKPIKLVISTLLICGECAAFFVVFGYSENVPQRMLALVSMVTGILIACWIWLPNFPINPDTQQP
jgi:hypothetical protein